MPTRIEVWRRWQAAAGPWQGWSICPALFSPEPVPPSTSRQHPLAERLAAHVAPLLLPGGALCVLDLEPTLGVQTAARLSRWAHPVLVLPRWPYAEAILPTAELLTTVMREAHHLHTAERLPNAVFVVDGQRSTSVPERSQNDPRADNRHVLTPFELPNLATLRARGIERIHRILSA